MRQLMTVLTGDKMLAIWQVDFSDRTKLFQFAVRYGKLNRKCGQVELQLASTDERGHLLCDPNFFTYPKPHQEDEKVVRKLDKQFNEGIQQSIDEIKNGAARKALGFEPPMPTRITRFDLMTDDLAKLATKMQELGIGSISGTVNNKTGNVTNAKMRHADGRVEDLGGPTA